MVFSENNTEGNLTVKNSALAHAGALYLSITAFVSGGICVFSDSDWLGTQPIPYFRLSQNDAMVNSSMLQITV